MGKTLFLCDGEVPTCKKSSCYKNAERKDSCPTCHYTSDVTHAVNFKKTRQPNGSYYERGPAWEAIYGTAEELFLKFTYKNGKTGTFRYSDIIHLRQDYEGNDIFGENPAPALAQLMECVGYIDQGIVKAIKNSGIIRWLLKFTSSMRPEDVKTNVEQFVKNYLAIETDTFGAAGVDAKVDAKQIEAKDYVPNASQTDRITDRIYSFFNTNKHIVQSDWNEDQWTCPRDVMKVLSAAVPGDEIEVYINSPGGIIDVGSEIYTLLRSAAEKHDMRIYIMGEACSAASIVACAAYCEMSPTALMMVHCVSSGARGNHSDMEHMAEVLRTADQALCTAYTAKTGMSESDALEMMENETWLTAEQAKERGLIDKVMFQEPEEKQPFVAAVNFHLPSSEQMAKVKAMMEADTGDGTEKEKAVKIARARAELLSLAERKLMD